MLALRLALANSRWAESWQHQHRLRQRQYHRKRKLRQQQRFLAQQAKRQQAGPPASLAPTTVKPARQKIGRTEAQYRCGRQTFSSRMLKQADAEKWFACPNGIEPRCDPSSDEVASVLTQQAGQVAACAGV